jgi:hypothetical protein
MTQPTSPIRQEWDDFSVSLVRNDLLFRLHRRIGLIPPDGLGIGRRAVFWTLLAWLPLAVWAALNGRALQGTVEEPLMAHFAVHARLLIAIPAFHLAEALSHRALGAFVPHFVRSGLVAPASVPAFKDALRDIARLRDRILPWVAIAGISLAMAARSATQERVDELSWAAEPSGGLGFGGWWLMVVARPIFLVLLLGWLWRLALLFQLFRKISRIDLSLVPTHADGVAGLGFIERVPVMFAPVVFALSTVLAATWGHQVVYHGVHVAELRSVMIAFLVLVLVLFLAPNFAFAQLLKRTKRRALLEYGALISRQGRLVHDRWIEGRVVDGEGVLDAPELGPTTDINALYQPIEKMRPAPIGLPTVFAVLAPAVVPMIPVLAIEIPIKELLLRLVKALV